MKTIRLKEGKERSLLRRHPWIFDSAIARGGADAGETVRVESHAGDFLAWAAFSPTSRIRARAWSFDEQQRIDAAFLGTLIERAVRTRELFDIRSDGLRLIHGESDGLPGLIVDRYSDTLVAQFTSCGVERWKDVIADALLRTTGLSRLYERSDASARTLEGLPEATGWLRGDGPTELGIREHDWRLTLDIATGHKTGFYLDQRDSRARFAAHARHRGFQRVLNCYCYTGGFTVAALAGGAAHVTSIDSSAPALTRARAHVALNGFEAARADFLDADVNASLRCLHRGGAQLRRHRAGSAEIRAYCCPRRTGGTRLQGHQPAGLQAAGAWRRTVHLFLLRRHQRRPVSQDRRLGRHRRRRGGLHQRTAAGCARPPDDRPFPRGRVPEGPGGGQKAALKPFVYARKWHQPSAIWSYLAI
jgi:23S rRNA (cytosine1962-C5)-methyltransferase